MSACYCILKLKGGAGSVPCSACFMPAMSSDNAFIVWRAFTILCPSDTADQKRALGWDLNVAVRGGIVYG